MPLAWAHCSSREDVATDAFVLLLHPCSEPRSYCDELRSCSDENTRRCRRLETRRRKPAALWRLRDTSARTARMRTRCHTYLLTKNSMDSWIRNPAPPSTANLSAMRHESIIQSYTIPCFLVLHIFCTAKAQPHQDSTAALAHHNSRDKSMTSLDLNRFAMRCESDRGRSSSDEEDRASESSSSTSGLRPPPMLGFL